MKDNTDPRDALIERMVAAFDSLMTQVHSGVQPRDDDPAVVDAKAALGWGKLHLTVTRDMNAAIERQQPWNELLDMLNVPRGRKP